MSRLRHFIIVFFLLVAEILVAQCPKLFNYQAVVRDSAGMFITDKDITVKVAIRQKSATGSIVYAETHFAHTDAGGLFSIVIGDGDADDTYPAIDWGKGPYYLVTRIEQYSLTTTQQLVSVPYAMYADKAIVADTAIKAHTAIVAQQLASGMTASQQLSVSGDTIFLSQDGGFVKVPPTFSRSYHDLVDTPSVPVIPTVVSAFQNDAGYLTSYTEQQTLADVLALGNDAKGYQIKNVLDPTDSADAVTYHLHLATMDSINILNIKIDSLHRYQLMLDTQSLGLHELMHSAVRRADTIAHKVDGMLSHSARLVATVDSLKHVSDSLESHCHQRLDSIAGLVKVLTEKLPKLHTTPASRITISEALSGGTITDTGNSAIIERGICWSTTHRPSINDRSNRDGNGKIGSFTRMLSTLASNTTYYVRAFATNATGTAYGNEVSFTTLPAKPVVVTVGATTVAAHNASVQGNVVSTDRMPVIERGVCYDTLPQPSLNSGRTSHERAIAGLYNITLTNLRAVKKYYFRAYVITATDTAYGAVVSFTTLAEPPTVTTSAATYITTTTAFIGGIVVADGGDAVTRRGVLLSKKSFPAFTDSIMPSGSGNGEFSIQLSRLSIGDTYYFRAYAANSSGTAYGEVLSFATKALRPTVQTTAASSVSVSSAVTSGNVVSNGGAALLQRGICWATDADSLSVDKQHVEAAGDVGSFAVNLTNLRPNTKYYYCAYAANSSELVYGNIMDFTTGILPPTVSDPSHSNISNNGAQLGATINNDGGSLLIETGVCWSMMSQPTVADNHQPSSMPSAGYFYIDVSSLKPGTIYYYCAYVTTDAGTIYSAVNTFTTLPATASVATNNTSFITDKTAVASGTITNDGGAAITECGVCFSKQPAPTVDDSKSTFPESALGTYEVLLSDLEANTTYYLRTYVTNAAGTAYGNEVSFTTQYAE